MYSLPDYFFDIEFREHGSVTIWRDNRKDGGVTVIEEFFRLDEVTLIQFTGLEDKNGVEIYEGDILKYDGDKCPHCKKLIYDKHDLYVIKWNSEMCQFDCTNEDNYMSPEIWNRDMEVIGNIYEHPELLDSAVKE